MTKPKRFNQPLTVAGIQQMTNELYTNSPRTSVLALSVLIAIVNQQGVSPAEISQQVTNDRNSSSVQTIIKRLESWELVQLVDVPYKHGEHPRKELWLTTKAAKMFQLT
ncbi:MarR family transcriptional regulator [Reinekea sp. G2M2-21]|uniref:MarR family transcriptional regulator n=1 Tax=Reinekea sp. G2M2-21 TaxID=2788942 RepID=UPI0018AC54D1|nr:MarR family transcriptional regulator [Reinekea sp. G2M2-21]